MVFTQMHITNNTCNKTLLTILTLLKILPLLYLEFILKTVTMVTKTFRYILVDFNFDNPGDVTTLSPFFKAAVSFTINIQLLPCEDNSKLLECLIYM